MAAPGVVLLPRVSTSVPGQVMLDALRVKQVLSNGLTNALKHTVSGTVALQVRVCVGVCVYVCVCVCALLWRSVSAAVR